MKSEPKPFASLSSGLLARKGAAKPAMRPQGFTQLGSNLEDLGWNDMGNGDQPAPEQFEEPAEHVPSSIAALTPAPKPNEVGQAVGTPVPVEQQRTIADSFGAPEDYEGEEYYGEDIEEIESAASAPIAPIVVPAAPIVAASVPAAPVARRPRNAPGQKDKAAFTLRLDSERHLKLRLACAVNHRSAQQIVSQALDAYLKSLPELDALAQQVPVRSTAKN